MKIKVDDLWRIEDITKTCLYVLSTSLCMITEQRRMNKKRKNCDSDNDSLSSSNSNTSPATTVKKVSVQMTEQINDEHIYRIISNTIQISSVFIVPKPFTISETSNSFTILFDHVSDVFVDTKDFVTMTWSHTYVFMFTIKDHYMNIAYENIHYFTHKKYQENDDRHSLCFIECDYVSTSNLKIYNMMNYLHRNDVIVVATLNPKTHKLLLYPIQLTNYSSSSCTLPTTTTQHINSNTKTIAKYLNLVFQDWCYFEPIVIKKNDENHPKIVDAKEKMQLMNIQTCSNKSHPNIFPNSYNILFSENWAQWGFFLWKSPPQQSEELLPNSIFQNCYCFNRKFEKEEKQNNSNNHLQFPITTFHQEKNMAIKQNKLIKKKIHFSNLFNNNYQSNINQISGNENNDCELCCCMNIYDCDEKSINLKRRIDRTKNINEGEKHLTTVTPSSSLLSKHIPVLAIVLKNDDNNNNESILPTTKNIIYEWEFYCLCPHECPISSSSSSSSSFL